MGLRALRALDGLVDDLVVVGRDDLDPSWPGRSFIGPREGSGPFGALVDVFETLTSRYVVALPCDMPMFARAQCEMLLRSIQASQSDLCVACTGDSTPQWLAGAWRVESVRNDAISAFESGVRSVERFVSTRTTDLVSFDPQFVLNLNEARLS
jgi:molybdopterin-guanine dinucleotide biosynthesis protein A